MIIISVRNSTFQIFVDHWKAFPDCRELLDEYQSAEIDLTALSNRYEFSKGFRLAQLVLEMIKLLK